MIHLSLSLSLNTQWHNTFCAKLTGFQNVMDVSAIKCHTIYRVCIKTLLRLRFNFILDEQFWVDEISKILFPAAFSIFNLVFWCYVFLGDPGQRDQLENDGYIKLQIWIIVKNKITCTIRVFWGPSTSAISKNFKAKRYKLISAMFSLFFFFGKSAEWRRVLDFLKDFPIGVNTVNFNWDLMPWTLNFYLFHRE